MGEVPPGCRNTLPAICSTPEATNQWRREGSGRAPRPPFAILIGPNRTIALASSAFWTCGTMTPWAPQSRMRVASCGSCEVTLAIGVILMPNAATHTPGGRVVSRADLLHAGMWEGAEALELPQKASHSFLELLEPNREPAAIGTILIPPRPVDHLPDNPFQPEFEKRAIMDFE